MAGFGTAGSMLAGGAVLFVLASAIVAFQGWPRIATQGSPAAIQVSATPAPPSLVSRRLRAVGSPPPTAGAVGALRAGVRAAASPAARPVGLQIPNGGTGRPPVPSSTPGRAGGPTRSGGSGSQNATVSTPTNPPVTLPAPVGTVTHRVETGVGKATGTAGNTVSSAGGQAGSAVGGPVGSTVTKVSSTAGNTLSQLGSGLGG